LHVPFKLDRTGESIGLYAPNGSLIDSVTFGTQTNNVSQGRYPDGAAEFRFFTKPTPDASNVAAFKVEAATIDNAGNLTISWQSQPGQTYRVQFKRDLNDASWNDLGEVTAIGPTSQTLDTANPDSSRFYRIVETTP
jgi:hypothetical protein